MNIEKGRRKGKEERIVEQENENYMPEDTDTEIELEDKSKLHNQVLKGINPDGE